MDIELANLSTSALPANNTNKSIEHIPTSIEFNADSQTDNSYAIESNEATALLQLVISRLSGAVIRQIPPDEYARLLSIIDDIISGSVNKRI